MPPALSVTAADELPAPETVTVKTTEPPVGTLALLGLSDTEIAVVVCTGVVLSDGADVCPHAERKAVNTAVIQLAVACRCFLRTHSQKAMCVPLRRSASVRRNNRRAKRSNPLSLPMVEAKFCMDS
jgi:hypothetical protein